MPAELVVYANMRRKPQNLTHSIPSSRAGDRGGGGGGVGRGTSRPSAISNNRRPRDHRHLMAMVVSTLPLALLLLLVQTTGKSWPEAGTVRGEGVGSTTVTCRTKEFHMHSVNKLNFNCEACASRQLSRVQTKWEDESWDKAKILCWYLHSFFNWCKIDWICPHWKLPNWLGRYMKIKCTLVQQEPTPPCGHLNRIFLLFSHLCIIQANLSHLFWVHLISNKHMFSPRVLLKRAFSYYKRTAFSTREHNFNF